MLSREIGNKSQHAVVETEISIISFFISLTCELLLPGAIIKVLNCMKSHQRHKIYDDNAEGVDDGVKNYYCLILIRNFSDIMLLYSNAHSHTQITYYFRFFCSNYGREASHLEYSFLFNIIILHIKYIIYCNVMVRSVWRSVTQRHFRFGVREVVEEII